MSTNELGSVPTELTASGDDSTAVGLQGGFQLKAWGVGFKVGGGSIRLRGVWGLGIED